MVWVSKQKVFNTLLVIIVIMLFVNGYTLFLFIRGFSQSDADNYSVSNFNFNTQTKLPKLSQSYLESISRDILYNESVPSIRFRISGPEEDPLVIIVPGDGSSSSELLKVAQKIRYKYEELIKKSKEPRYRGPTSVPSAARLKRILRSGAVNKKADFKQIWANIQEWPFSDSLRLMSLGQVLYLARKAAIKDATNSRRGTQLKVEVTLEGGLLAYFKPRWYSRDLSLEGNVYGGKDRHFGEIAAFYLNLILGYNNAPIVVGRKVDLPKEILQVATPSLKDTFFRSSNGSMCFFGVCHFCTREDPVCASKDELEGALVLIMEKKFRTTPSPWRRTYKVGNPAPWEPSMDFCLRVMRDSPHLKRVQNILDMVAVSIFDFLIGNGDRHHFEMHLKTDPDASSHSNKIILIDNGKSFGNSGEDYLDILAPLFQCCKIRESLHSTLKKFDGQLGKWMDVITQTDPLYPLLKPEHLRALDRRLKIVLATVDYCLDTQTQNNQQSQQNRKVFY